MALSEFPLEHTGTFAPSSGCISESDKRKPVCMCLWVTMLSLSHLPSWRPELKAQQLPSHEIGPLPSLLWLQFLTCIMGTRALQGYADMDRTGLDRGQSMVLFWIPGPGFPFPLSLLIVPFLFLSALDHLTLA